MKFNFLRILTINLQKPKYFLTLFIVVGVILIAGSCSQLMTEMEGRALLSKVQFNFKSVEYQDSLFTKLISVVSGEKKLSFELDKIGADIIDFAIELSKGNFSFPTKELKLKANVEIVNPNDKDVIMDKFDGEVWLDGQKLLAFSNDDKITVPAKQTLNKQIDLVLPLNIDIKRLANPVELEIKGKVYLSLKVFEFTFNHEQEFSNKIPVPTDQIKSKADTVKQEYLRKIVDYIKSKTLDLLKGIKLPSF